VPARGGGRLRTEAALVQRRLMLFHFLDGFLDPLTGQGIEALPQELGIAQYFLSRSRHWSHMEFTLADTAAGVGPKSDTGTLVLFSFKGRRLIRQ
jgi:hypothetical protein